MNSFFSFGRVLLDFLFPSPCPVCGDPSSSWPACRVCLDTIRRVPAGCMRCGRAYADKDIKYLVPNILCGECLLEKRPKLDETRSAIIYEKTAKDLICLFKYQGRTRLLKFFTPFMKETLLEWGRLKDCDYIVPVPLHNKKFRKRTFNPSLLLADVISRNCRVPVMEHLLIRPVAGIKQAGLRKKERTKAVKGVFAAPEGKKEMAGKRILLVDDVFTTGATARECAKTLKKAGAEKIYVFTLARTVK